MRTIAMLLLAVGVTQAQPGEPPQVFISKLLTVKDEKHAVQRIAWLPGGIVAGYQDGTTRVWDLATEKVTATLPPPKLPEEARKSDAAIAALDVSRDGNSIAIGYRAAGLKIWNRKTDSVATVPDATLLPDREVQRECAEIVEIAFDSDSQAVTVRSFLGTLSRFSTDGKALGKPLEMPKEFGKGEEAYIREEAAVALRARIGFAYYEGNDVDEFRTWDYAQQKVIATAKLKDLTRPVSYAIDPTGRRVVIGDRMKQQQGVRKGPIPKLQIVDPLTMQDVRVLEMPWYFATAQKEIAADFSQDGRILHTRGGSVMHDFYDVATGTRIARASVAYQVRDAAACWIAARRFALASTSTIQLFDLQATLDPAPPKSHDALACWNDLVSPDGTVALRAVYRLADHPEESLKLIAERVKPSVRPSADDIATWLKSLDAPAFAERAAALKKLTPFADTIEAELTKELAENASPEVVKSVTAMLESMQRGRRKLEGEYLRVYRAVQVLEMIGPPAKQLLKSYAAGAKGTFLTHEALWALSR